MCVGFYEPVASEIRSIQRRGRAGRAKAGEVVFLITKGTRDEVAYWVARRKEKKMRKIVAGWSERKEGKTKKEEKSEKTLRKRHSSKQSSIVEFLGDGDQ